MATFITDDFLLSNEVAKHLYNEVKDLPIIDYHCHISPKEIYEDKQFTDITDLWLKGDHYKWRLMRSNGIPEEYITGNAPAKEKFLKFADTLPKCIGNPMIHWCHLELKKYFNYNEFLTKDTGPQVWDLVKEQLTTNKNLTARGLISQSNVEMIGTTDDPCDSLEYHRLLKDDSSFKHVKVCPSFRPDKALNPQKPGFIEYIKKLSDVSQIPIQTTSDVKRALSKRLDLFEELGCRAADHGIDHFSFVPCSFSEADDVLKKAINGDEITNDEAMKYMSNILLFCAREYAKRNIVMQLHFNCQRNPNAKMFKMLGPDTGFDVMDVAADGRAITRFLNALDETGSLPRTILYSLNNNDNAMIDTIIGAFQDASIPGKIQHGSAWWFNDTKIGMEAQLESLASLGILGNFVGMLTDSRSFLSYTRHDYFRRILCNYLGKLVKNGEYPEDMELLSNIAKNICYFNAKSYFGL